MRPGLAVVTAFLVVVSGCLDSGPRDGTRDDTAEDGSRPPDATRDDAAEDSTRHRDGTGDDAGDDSGAPSEGPYGERREGQPHLWARVEASFEDRTCPEPRPHAADRYQGRLIDTHFHLPIVDGRDADDPLPPQQDRGTYIGEDATIDDLVCNFRYESTDGAFGFFSVHEGMWPYHIELTRRTMERYPDAFVPFISPPAERPTVDAETLDGLLAMAPGVFRGFGEIGLYSPGDGGPDLPPNDPLLLAIYPLLRENGLVSYFHLGTGQMEEYIEIIEANPDLTFVFHGDHLIDYVDGEQDMWRIETILRDHDNVFYGVDELYGDQWLVRDGVTKAEFLAHFEDYRPLLEKDKRNWKAFIERYPDRSIWGTDRGAEVEWSLDPEVGWTLNDYGRAFIATLDPDVQDRFAYQNAERIFGITD